nr:MAG TPA: hypothetical protein [Bacteriophage sp.]
MRIFCITIDILDRVVNYLSSNRINHEFIYKFIYALIS